MKAYEIIEKIEGLYDQAWSSNIGSNEAELEYKHLVADWILKQTKDNSKVTRLEVIDSKGRQYVAHGCSDVELSYQDEGRTLKIFLENE